MSIKLVSWNVNGIRAVAKKEEFWDWFDSTDADIINFQEVRASEDKIPKKLANIEGFNSCFNDFNLTIILGTPTSLVKTLICF